MTRRRGRLLAVIAALAATGCGDRPSGEPAAAGAVSGRVTVFAAASLTEVFQELGEQVEAAHPGVRVIFNFGASSGLAQSIVAGAPADVFAAASSATMDVVTRAGDAAAPTVFARNRLEIAVPPGNPAAVAGLADLGRAELKVAVCAPQVPCGGAAERAFTAAGVTPAPDTLEQDVKAALAKVRLGEVDAALVYRTDVRAAGSDVEGIGFPEAGEAVNDYLVAPLSGAPQPAAARAFVAYLLSAEGERALAAAGFEPA